MIIVIAPDAFKESLSSIEVTKAIQQGFSLAIHDAEYVTAPMADGGAGTLDTLREALPIVLHSRKVTGPLFEQHQARFGILEQDNTAIIEMAEASGLHCVPVKKRNPLAATSYGTGELILHALEKGCRKFIIGLGGSATCDGGMGALAALGIQFKDESDKPLKPIAENLTKIKNIDTRDIPSKLLDCEIILAHDVENTFLGLEGALMYAPQKGASPKDIEILHKGFEHYALVLQKYTQKDLSQPGLGSAGGLAIGLYSFLHCRLRKGGPLIMDLINLAHKMKNANLVITGEGQLDAQTLFGKTPLAVAKLAKSMNIPVIAFTGCLEGDVQDIYHQGIDAAFSIAQGAISKEISIKKAKPLLIQAAYNVARLIRLRILS